MRQFDSTDWKFLVALLALMLAVIAVCLWPSPKPVQRENISPTVFSDSTKYNLLLPNVLCERITSDSANEFLRIYVKRQMILDKDQLGDCGGENLPPSLKPFRLDLLALNGVENIDIRAYEIWLQKARTYSWSEVENDVKELIEKHYPYIAVEDKKGE